MAEKEREEWGVEEVEPEQDGEVPENTVDGAAELLTDGRTIIAW